MNPKSTTTETPAYVTKMHVRQDANRIALRAIRDILDAAKPLRIDIEGVPIEISVKRLSQGAWPQDTWGVDENQDGPWPRPVQFDCSWPGGNTQLVASAQRASGQYFPLICLRISCPLARSRIVWINVAAPLRENMGQAAMAASASLVNRIPQDDEGKERRARRSAKIIALLERSMLPMVSRSGMDAFQIGLPDGRVFPSAEEAIKRLLHLALLKLPIWVKDLRHAINGKPYLDPEVYVPGEEDVDAEDNGEDELDVDEDVADNNTQETSRPPVKPYSIDDILNDGCFLERSELERILARLRSKKNLILQGPPGTGKTWLAKRLGYALMAEKDSTRLRSVQFHPNLSYEDFVRGHRPGENGTLKLENGHFLKMITDAQKRPHVPHVFVIEEINRGNPAQIFGEMLTLLEADKRKPEEALELCYSRTDGESVERIHIPDNLYVIGTMNIADRSIAPLDMALRRRFAFIDLEPAFGSRWREWVRTHGNVPAELLQDIEKRLQALNEEIAKDKKLGRHFCIGHSFVTPHEVVNHAQDWFRGIVDTEIGPVLDEYWFDEPETARKAKERLLKGA